MIFKPKSKLTQADYFFYDEVCSLMDIGKRVAALEFCSKHKLVPHFFMVGCDEVVLLETETSIIVSVSGSDKDPEEWGGNVNAYRGIIDAIKKVPANKAGFHYNFYLQARKLKRAVKKWLKENGCKKPVIWVGHSRGGAIARIAYMLHNCEYNLIPPMAIVFDPPRSFTWFGWLWYQKNKMSKDVCHRIKAFTLLIGVGSVPPAFLGWVHRSSTLLRLPNVRGKLNHTHIKEGLIRKFCKEN